MNMPECVLCDEPVTLSTGQVRGDCTIVGRTDNGGCVYCHSRCLTEWRGLDKGIRETMMAYGPDDPNRWGGFPEPGASPAFPKVAKLTDEAERAEIDHSPTPIVSGAFVAENGGREARNQRKARIASSTDSGGVASTDAQGDGGGFGNLRPRTPVGLMKAAEASRTKAAVRHRRDLSRLIELLNSDEIPRKSVRELAKHMGYGKSYVSALLNRLAERERAR